MNQTTVKADHGDDRPQVGKTDLLLEALQRKHGPDGRPDIAPETVVRPWTPPRKEAP